MHAHLLAQLVSYSCCGCRWPSVSNYTNLVDMHKEWTDGIEYTSRTKKTVPFQQLEQDKQEGRQTHMWREGVARTGIADRKIFIYTALNAQVLSGRDPREFLAEVQSKAKTQLEGAPGKKGRPPTMFNTAKQIMATDYQQYYVSTAVPFEQSVLKWKISSGLAAQARTKTSQNGT